jgi:hypothetical protein
MQIVWNRERLGHFFGYVDGTCVAHVDVIINPYKRGWTVTLTQQEAELFDLYPNYDAAIAAAEAALADGQVA